MAESSSPADLQLQSAEHSNFPAISRKESKIYTWKAAEKSEERNEKEGASKPCCSKAAGAKAAGWNGAPVWLSTTSKCAKETSAQDGEKLGEDGSAPPSSHAPHQAAAASPRCFRPCSWLNIERVWLLLLESFCLDENEVMWGQVCAGAISLCLNTADHKQTKNSFMDFKVKAPLRRGFGLLLFRAKVWESSGRGYCRWRSGWVIRETLWHSEAVVGAQSLVDGS